MLVVPPDVQAGIGSRCRAMSAVLSVLPKTGPGRMRLETNGACPLAFLTPVFGFAAVINGDG